MVDEDDLISSVSRYVGPVEVTALELVGGRPSALRRRSWWWWWWLVRVRCHLVAIFNDFTAGYAAGDSVWGRRLNRLL